MSGEPFWFPAPPSPLSTLSAADIDRIAKAVAARLAEAARPSPLDVTPAELRRYQRCRR